MTPPTTTPPWIRTAEASCPPTREAREQEAYDTITDKIAGPSLRRSDNVASLVSVAIGFCAVGGVILSVMFTKEVLMIVGLAGR